MMKKIPRHKHFQPIILPIDRLLLSGCRTTRLACIQPIDLSRELLKKRSFTIAGFQRLWPSKIVYSSGQETHATTEIGVPVLLVHQMH